MPVNGDDGHAATRGVKAGRGAPRRTQAQRSAATRLALIDAARHLFAERGFSGTGREEIVERAGVTRGAMYHHFAGKEDLFRAVVEAVEHDVCDQIAMAAASGADALDQLRRGCLAFLDLAMQPAVRRIVMLDAPAVLGWEAWREIDAAYGLGMLKEGLAHVMAAGQLPPGPVDLLAHLLLGALNEAALLIANAEDPVMSRRQVGAVVEDLLFRLVGSSDAQRGQAGLTGPTRRRGQSSGRPRSPG